MILEELRNYRLNLQFCYEQIEWRGEHLGVADKFLIKQRYNQLILTEMLAEKIDRDSETGKPYLTDEDLYNLGNTKAGLQISVKETTTKYF